MMPYRRWPKRRLRRLQADSAEPAAFGQASLPDGTDVLTYRICDTHHNQDKTRNNCEA